MAASDLRRKVTRQLIGRLIEHEHGFKRKTFHFAVAMAIVYLLYLFCAGDYGLLRIQRLYDRQEVLETEYRTLSAEAVDYAYSLRRFRTDPHFVEWLARTRYGFSRPQEIIYHLKSPAP